MPRCHRLSGVFNENPAPIAPQTRTPSITSTFGCAIDVTNGRVLYDKGANLGYDYPASIVKIMTVLLVAELKAGSLSETVIWQTSDDLDAGFSQVGFTNGDVVTWTDLLHGMLMVSGGDACQVAARVLGNEDAGNSLTSTAGYARFIEMMNARAEQLGCMTTAFVNAHGAELHVTSARDMARITGECFENAAVDAVARASAYTINVTGANARSINLTNTTPTLSISGVKGVKTGSLSGGIYPTTFNLVTLWTAPSGDNIALCTMGNGNSTDRYNDTSGMISSLPTDFPYLAS